MIKKILIIGSEPSDFCNQISKRLISEGFVVDLWEYRKLSKKKEQDLQEYFSNVKTGISTLNIHTYSYFSILLQLFKVFFWSNLFQIKSIKNALRKALIKDELTAFFKQYDIVNFHFIDDNSLLFSEYISKSTKIVYSFWGSDLYLENNPLRKKQNEKIRHCDLVTLHSDEMEYFLNKNIPNSKEIRIEQLLFGVSNNYINKNKLIKDDFDKTSTIKNYGIDPNKIIISIGYSANNVSNHIPIINALANLNDNSKEKIHLMLPMTYGGDENYVNEVCTLIKNNNISYTCIKSFLPLDELIRIRLVSDIYIHANTTDAFSNSMLEYLLSNNICIIGDWLPYSRLKESDIFHLSLSQFNDITALIESSIKNIDKLRENTKVNPAITTGKLCEEYWINNWVKNYKTLL